MEVNYLDSSMNAGPVYALNARDFKKMILGANLFFQREKEALNALNVFPVPDGDTGTNMSMTLHAAINDSIAYEGESIGELSEIVASKALMGARGNSGVILSQLLRGIARGLKEKDCITPAELSKAFQYGVVYAYRAVSKPVEGTILTVAREMARGIRAAARKGECLHGSLEEAIKHGKETVARTREMLPALKEANVVDAGGLGLLLFFEGCLFALKNSVSDMLGQKPDDSLYPEDSSYSNENLAAITPAEITSLEYPYCTEALIKSETGIFSGLKEQLQPLGDSLLVVTDKNHAKIHIHTRLPGQILETAQAFGSLHDIKIENMLDQVNRPDLQAASQPSALVKSDPVPGTGLIAISFGEGFREIFLNLGAERVVFGGQTMNPKVEDLLTAIELLPQEEVIVLPNNKNIILVASQAADLSDKKVRVIETRTLPEGIAALLSFNHDQPLEDNYDLMSERVASVKSGAVTFATRDALINGIPVKKDDYLGLAGETACCSGKNLAETAFKLAITLLEDGADIITIFYGAQVGASEASALAELIREINPEVEIELHYGGQPIYNYIFSVE